MTGSWGMAPEADREEPLLFRHPVRCAAINENATKEIKRAQGFMITPFLFL